MRIRVSSPGTDLRPGEIDQIEKDLEKLDRRLGEREGDREVDALVRIANGTRGTPYHVVLEIDYGRTHLLAKADNADVGLAVREAREEIIRQINDRSRRGHSSFSKGRR
jgi:ribosome-associated translation inhibitor RaiA